MTTSKVMAQRDLRSSVAYATCGRPGSPRVTDSSVDLEAIGRREYGLELDDPEASDVQHMGWATWVILNHVTRHGEKSGSHSPST